MHLEFAMLADDVLTTSDNKLLIQGADVDSVQAASYPAVHPKLALVGTVVRDPSDDGDDEHAVRVETLTPRGESWLPPVQTAVKAPFRDEEHPAKASFILVFSMLVFPAKGHYVFRVFLDDTWVRDISLYAVEVTQGDVSVGSSDVSATHGTAEQPSAI